MKEFKGSPHPWHWEGDKLCDANHMIINGGKFKFKKRDKDLVTAAPDLLEALQEMTAIVKKNSYPQPDKPSSNYARAEWAESIISKALGEE